MGTMNRIIMAGIIGIFFLSASVEADDLLKQKESLEIIADFADRLCNKISITGSSENLELSGNAKAELNNILKKIADLGIQGAVKYQQSEYENVLQKDLAVLLRDSAKCKQEVWNDLKDKLLTPVTPDNRSESEKESETDYSLPGDAINHFRVIESAGSNLTIEVDYSYNKNHGEKVMAGAWLSPTQSGYKPTFVPKIGRGTVRVPIILNNKTPSDEINIFLYEWGRPAEQFAKRTYSFKRGWGN